MLNESVSPAQAQMCFVVTCYQNVVGVYLSQDDAAQVQRDLINKNRPADIVSRVLTPKSV